MKSLRILCIALMVLAVLLMPYAGFAQGLSENTPEWNISVEYRYSKGEEKNLDIPNTISRFGHTYYLIDKQPPVPEKTLPATRTYTWHIEGNLSEREKALLEESEGVTLTKTELLVERVIDRTVTVGGLTTNDVDMIPFTELFEAESSNPELSDPESSDPEAVADLEGFTRTAVKFEVESIDSMGLPATYKATAVYRKFESYMSSDFYLATATYSVDEELSGQQYVILTTYSPDKPAPADDQAGAGGAGSEGDGSVTPPIDAADDGEGALGDGTEGASGGSTFQMWTMIPVFIAIAFALCCMWMLKNENKRRKENRARREAKQGAA